MHENVTNVITMVPEAKAWNSYECEHYGLNTFFNFMGGKSVLANPLAYVAHFLVLRDVWIRTLRGATSHLLSHPSL